MCCHGDQGARFQANHHKMETDFGLNSSLKKVFKNERNHSCVFILCLRSDCSMMSSSDSKYSFSQTEAKEHSVI